MLAITISILSPMSHDSVGVYVARHARRSICHWKKATITKRFSYQRSNEGSVCSNCLLVTHHLQSIPESANPCMLHQLSSSSKECGKLWCTSVLHEILPNHPASPAFPPTKTFCQFKSSQFKYSLYCENNNSVTSVGPGRGVSLLQWIYMGHFHLSN